jgi:hypothetical protein
VAAPGGRVRVEAPRGCGHPRGGRRQEEQHRIRADAPDTRARPRPTGAALLANPTTEVPATDAEVLAAGQVDPRPLSLLAAIGARLGLGLQGLPAVPDGLVPDPSGG